MARADVEMKMWVVDALTKPRGRRMPAYSSNYETEGRERRFGIAEKGMYRSLQRNSLLGNDGKKMDTKMSDKRIRLLRRCPETV